MLLFADIPQRDTDLRDLFEVIMFASLLALFFLLKVQLLRMRKYKSALLVVGN